jgi:glucose/mannose-6-phosphate isomerase
MNLDNQNNYKKLDKQFVGKSIELLPDQMRQVLSDARLIKIPKEYSKINKVVLAGMGGSNLGIRIMRQAFAEQIKVPININAGYGVPNYVDENTLYIISSYSGTTEEPLSTYHKAKKKGAKIIAITENIPESKLRKIMIRDDVPGYTFEPEQNPSGQPRLGLGYSIFGIAVMLAKAGVINVNVKEMEKIIDLLEINSRKLRVSSPSTQNIAKKTAIKLNKKTPILIGAEFLSGNLHTMRNQINETAKTFSSYLILPDLNHYAMEGLQYPSNNKKNLQFVFFNSNLYSSRIQERLQLTKKVVRKNGVEVLDIKLKAKTKKAQCFELLQFGSWMSFYMGIMYGINPVSVPWVDWFKRELK